MALEEKLTIEDTKYIIYPFGASKALKVFKILMDKVGAPLALMMNGLNLSDIMKSEINGEAISKGINELSSKMDEDEFTDLIIDLLTKVEILEKNQQVPINKDMFDVQFAGGRISHIPKLIMAVVKLNYANFLPKGGGGIVGKAAKTASPTDT